MNDVLDAVETFFTHLSSVEPVPVLLGVGCHLVDSRAPAPRLTERDRRRVPG